MNCIDLTLKRSKMLRYFSKLQKWSNYPMNCIDLTSKRSKCWVTSQNIQNKAKLKSDTMNCIDLTSERSKMLSYVAKHSKLSKTTKVIKLQWIASIRRQNDQNVELRLKTTKVIKLQWISSIWRQNDQNNVNSMKIRWLASIWRQNDQNVELRRKTFNTTLNYKSDQITMNCIDLTSKRSKCWVTSQNIQNKGKLQKWSKSNDLHRFDVKTIKMLSYVAKHSKQS